MEEQLNKAWDILGNINKSSQPKPLISDAKKAAIDKFVAEQSSKGRGIEGIKRAVLRKFKVKLKIQE